MVVARPLRRLEDQLGSLHPSIRGDRMHQYQARAGARRLLDPWTFVSAIPWTRRRVRHLDRAFIEINFRTDRPTMRAPVGECGASILTAGHQHVIPFSQCRLAPRCPIDKAHPLSRPPPRRRMHALIRLAEPMQERADTDGTPLPMALTHPLAHDFFQWRLHAVGGLALCCNSGRKAWPRAVRGTEQVFDGPFPKAQRRGNTARWVLRRYHSASPTFLVKAFRLSGNLRYSLVY